MTRLRRALLYVGYWGEPGPVLWGAGFWLALCLVAWSGIFESKSPPDDVTRWYDARPASCRAPMEKEPAQDDPQHDAWWATLPPECLDWFRAFPDHEPLQP